MSAGRTLKLDVDTEATRGNCCVQQDLSMLYRGGRNRDLSTIELPVYSLDLTCLCDKAKTRY